MDSDLLGIIRFIVSDYQVHKKNSHIFSSQNYLNAVNWNSFQCAKDLALILVLDFSDSRKSC